MLEWKKHTKPCIRAYWGRFLWGGNSGSSHGHHRCHRGAAPRPGLTNSAVHAPRRQTGSGRRTFSEHRFIKNLRIFAPVSPATEDLTGNAVLPRGFNVLHLPSKPDLQTRTHTSWSCCFQTELVPVSNTLKCHFRNKTHTSARLILEMPPKFHTHNNQKHQRIGQQKK